jgi:7-cyano-7-deazaguanine reductase
MTTQPLLGRQVGHPIAVGELDTIPCPAAVGSVVFSTTELSATCAVTGQPDLYEATLTYVPNGTSLESKALKHYLWSFRDEKIFAEDLAAKIATELSARLDARVYVTLVQQIRGGLVLKVSADTP